MAHADAGRGLGLANAEAVAAGSGPTRIYPFRWAMAPEK